MAPIWLEIMAWCALGAGITCSAWFLVEIYARGYRQPMPVMDLVWPITGLYAGPLAVAFYRRFGRPATARWAAEHPGQAPPEAPRWAKVATSASHCGAGCTLGDIVGEIAIAAIGLTVVGSRLVAEYIGDYVLAIAFGLAFQYFAIAPMRGLGVRAGVTAAAKADIVSLTAFEVGMFGWMALTSLVLFGTSPPLPTSPVFWFMMQIGMCLGFLTTGPINVWLIRRGVKEAM